MEFGSPDEAAQIFDNLVGRKSNVRQNFESTEANQLGSSGLSDLSKGSNESLIPAQNQRWRRA